jgi:hypothetical protein
MSHVCGLWSNHSIERTRPIRQVSLRSVKFVGRAVQLRIRWETMKTALQAEEARRAGVDFPAADVSVVWHSHKWAVLTLVMHFSRIVEGPDQDLEVMFGSPLAFQWEEESYGLIGLPEDLPKCSAPRWKTYTVPILQVDGSPWADLYASRVFTETERETKQVLHYAFISLNDLVHVLSIERPTLRWVKSLDP